MLREWLSAWTSFCPFWKIVLWRDMNATRVIHSPVRCLSCWRTFTIRGTLWPLQCPGKMAVLNVLILCCFLEKCKEVKKNLKGKEKCSLADTVRHKHPTNSKLYSLFFLLLLLDQLVLLHGLISLLVNKKRLTKVFLTSFCCTLWESVSGKKMLQMWDVWLQLFP